MLLCQAVVGVLLVEIAVNALTRTVFWKNSGKGCGGHVPFLGGNFEKATQSCISGMVQDPWQVPLVVQPMGSHIGATLLHAGAGPI